MRQSAIRQGNPNRREDPKNRKPPAAPAGRWSKDEDAETDRAKARSTQQITEVSTFGFDRIQHTSGQTHQPAGCLSGADNDDSIVCCGLRRNMFV